MKINTLKLGDFAVFGFTQDNNQFLQHRLPERLGITPRTINFGPAGYFFFHTTFGDMAESEEMVALKLGSVRSPDRTPLSTRQLLDQKALTSDNVNPAAFRGSALLACFNKHKPEICAYQTLLVTPPLFYSRLNSGLICATDIRCLLALLDRVELHPDAYPMHLLFDVVIGPQTYFRDVWRLFPGQRLTWQEGALDVKLIQTLRLPPDTPRIKRLTTGSIDRLYRGMSEIVGLYMDEVRASGSQAGNLLSGGVDSSTLQLLINNHLSPSEPPLSFGYAVPEAGSFEFEIEYARHASELLHTRHTYHNISAQNFPDYLIRTIQTLAQPNLYNEGEACKLALAEHLAANTPHIHYFFTAQGADGLHGMDSAKKMALFDAARPIPASSLALRLAAALVAPVSHQKAHGLRDVAQMLVDAQQPRSLTAPPNHIALAVDLEQIRRLFGDETIWRLLEYRNNLEAEYLNSPTMTEKTQIIDFLTASYEPGINSVQLFTANRKRIILPFLDED